MNEEQDKYAELKKGLVTALKALETFSSAAAVVNPIFGVAGPVIRLVLNKIDDEDRQMLQREFDSVNRTLDDIFKKHHEIQELLPKQMVDSQLFELEQSLHNQVRSFIKMMEAGPDLHKHKREEFVEMYKAEKEEQILNSLYSMVMGTSGFSEPILEVYVKYCKSQGERHTLEDLCERLMQDFYIGLMAFMGYAAIIGEDLESEGQKWEEKMKEVREKMKKALDSL